MHTIFFYFIQYESKRIYNYMPLYYTYAINLIEMQDYYSAKIIINKGIELAISNNKEKVKNELLQLNELYLD